MAGLRHALGGPQLEHTRLDRAAYRKAEGISNFLETRCRPRSGQSCAPGCVLSVSVSSVPARTCADEQGQGSTLPNPGGSGLHTLSSLVTRETGRGAGRGGGGLRPQLTGPPCDPQPALHVWSSLCGLK